MNSNSNLTFDEVTKKVMDHVRARKWDVANTSRGLAISVSLEASGLLEYYQWKDENFGGKDDLASEVADIFIYLIQFADKNEIDILPEIVKKIEKTAKKYPVEIFEIEDEAEHNKVWLEAERAHKKDTTL